jgi:N-hydroxyarylamine O-acetyltransferase
MTMIGRATPTGEWEIDRLDLDAYLERVGYAGALAADAATLRGLHRAHAAAIPFENLDIVLGRTIELDLDSVQDKLVRRPRGGYCFEHNTLFAAVLERLGYAVTRLSARVNPSRPGPRTHMALRVVADGSPWLADVGFGASLLEPLPLQPATATQGGWRYRLAATGADAWLLQADEADGWSDLYAFTLEPQRPIDYEVYNHYTATHPRSRFVGRVVALRTEPDVRYALRGAQLTTTRPDGAADERQVDVGEVPDLLAARFGIGLSPEEAACLRQVAVNR